jgi:hypothetical protein
MTNLESARRDAVARLCLAQASGFLSVEAFEERYSLITEATSVATLEGLVADLTIEEDPLLPVPTSSYELEPITADSGAVTGADGWRAPRAVAAASSVRIPAVFGSAERGGTWTVPEHLEVMVTLGEVKLDFRDAVFTTDTVELDVSVLLGSLNLILPPGTQVENECEEFMASSAHPSRGRKGAPPNGILVIIRGHVRIGELNIKERGPTGSEPPRFKGFFQKFFGKPGL